MSPRLSCRVVDAGARYGLHPTWNGLRDIVDFELFEMDVLEAERLKDIYSEYPNIRVHSCALFSSRCSLKYQARRHKGLNSLFDSNTDVVRRNQYFVEESACEVEEETEAWPVDLLFESEDVHFMKIDTEGAELEILKGAEAKLRSTLLGVRAEVNFEQLCKDTPLFGEIHDFMRGHDFELVNLDYDGRGHPASEFTLPDRYGRLIGGDAVWIKKLDSVLTKGTDTLTESVILLSLFLLNNHASDIALDLLLRAVQEKNVSFDQWRDDPLFAKLQRAIAFLFKEMFLLPSSKGERLLETFELLFGMKFPTGHQFYETYSL